MLVPLSRKTRHIARVAPFACAVAPSVACAAAAPAAPGNPAAPLPLAYVVHAAGPAAQPVFVLGWALLALCTFVCIAIAVLLLIALFRRRARVGGGHGSGLTIVTVGSAISILLLFGALVYMLRVLGMVAAPPRPPALTITVTAQDWWWAVRYPDDAGGPAFVTANEIHIPVGEPVAIELKSADVIHAFWVPQLAGKTQTIPGQTNRQWLQADRPGIYRGQCSQYCGAQHAHMAFEVVAEPPAAFQAWLAAQRQPARAPAAGASAERRGQRVFAARCAGCHAVRGTDAAGDAGPDLTHVGTRRLLAAGTLDNTPDNLRRWIAHAQQVKPQSLMPSIALAPRDADDLAAYLATLH
ncbi:cytochrome c oxidase subunit II [Burkholderia cenocepacia]|uniref:cytochrome c oxidase subunit II n=1 Tax=Burkholderia cenocepacia TaxID=95486 RepID=UPI000846F52A|nr:cytochrome c oxidase subunit II [Burkholderia cenocepacia]MDR8103542.1 cytochrome c oxidase subunit II [Burkholderia cenocepacia]CAB5090924.1 putative cytochrome c oxidase polypeptide II precursor [Burkholderia cenocepacia]CAB5157123.1 putative cytochrome c oxidase polypeptide II precursor [Burkholderia cenocepacia]CAB5160917.1 putative cytochrome c oxidase polypeptide II precursor [Burkholderia cenocepacia]CAB5163599.1 putative cytochrome c oxidase polypeptide II precursor [Burkholderia ce